MRSRRNGLRGRSWFRTHIWLRSCSPSKTNIDHSSVKAEEAPGFERYLSRYLTSCSIVKCEYLLLDNELSCPMLRSYGSKCVYDKHGWGQVAATSILFATMKIVFSSDIGYNSAKNPQIDLTHAEEWRGRPWNTHCVLYQKRQEDWSPSLAKCYQNFHRTASSSSGLVKLWLTLLAWYINDQAFIVESDICTP